jgi:hypothetical protein
MLSSSTSANWWRCKPSKNTSTWKSTAQRRYIHLQRHLPHQFTVPQLSGTQRRSDVLDPVTLDATILELWAGLHRLSVASAVRLLVTRLGELVGNCKMWTSAYVIVREETKWCKIKGTRSPAEEEEEEEEEFCRGTKVFELGTASRFLLPLCMWNVARQIENNVG